MQQATNHGVEMISPTYPLFMEGGAGVENNAFFKLPAELTYGTGNYMATLEIHGVSERGGGVARPAQLITKLGAHT